MMPKKPGSPEASTHGVPGCVGESLERAVHVAEHDLLRRPTGR